MPIYEYHCPKCDQLFDRLQKVDAPRQIACLHCDCQQAQRVTSMPSFRLKGDGWYETDFKTSNRRHLAGDGGKPADGNKGKEGKKAKEVEKSSTSSKQTVSKASSESSSSTKNTSTESA